MLRGDFGEVLPRMSGSGSESIGHDPMRRNDLAKEALDVGMDDPYWLHNLSVDTRYHEGHDDMLDVAADLRADAELLEEAHNRLKEGELTGAEAAVFLARRVSHPDRVVYEVSSWLTEEMPITEEP